MSHGPIINGRDINEGAGKEEWQFMKGLSGDKEGIKSLDFML